MMSLLRIAAGIGVFYIGREISDTYASGCIAALVATHLLYRVSIKPSHG